MRTVGPLGVDKASASVTAPLQISADTLKENTKAEETFYRIRVRTTRNYLEKNGRVRDSV